MNKRKSWITDSSDEFIDTTKNNSKMKHPNKKAQKAIEKRTIKKSKMGRKKDPKGTNVQIEIKEINRQDDTPLIIVSGTGRRNDTKSLTLPIPIEIFERIKSESSNTSASFIGLIKYAIDHLDDNLKSIIIKHIKNT